MRRRRRRRNGGKGENETNLIPRRPPANKSLRPCVFEMQVKIHDLVGWTRGDRELEEGLG